MPSRVVTKLQATGHVLIGKLAVALGLRREVDGWRRIVGVGLREEHAKFAVATFGLTRPANLIEAFAAFLREEPDARFVLDSADHLTVRLPRSFVDLAELGFDESGRLTSIVPRFDTQSEAASAVDAAVAVVMSAANETANFPEPVRPGELLNRVRHLTNGNAVAFKSASRLAAATCMTVERVTETERFAPPAMSIRRGLGFGHLTFVIRPFDDAIDVWAYAHHTGTDGVPLQELVGRFATAWGSAGRVTFPEPDSEPVIRPCSVPGERNVFKSISFHDFGPLLAERKRWNAARKPDDAEVTLGGLFMWELAREPELTGVRYGSTVDVGATNQDARCVDMISLRPADYPGLAEFASAYDGALKQSRNKSGPARAAIRTAALLPPRLHRRMLELFPEVTDATFGTVGLSILRDAPLFIAPHADLGFAGGFIAIGNMTLPTVSGRRVGAVTVKGDRDTVERVPRVVRRMLQRLG